MAALRFAPCRSLPVVPMISPAVRSEDGSPSGEVGARLAAIVEQLVWNVPRTSRRSRLARRGIALWGGPVAVPRDVRAHGRVARKRLRVFCCSVHEVEQEPVPPTSPGRGRSGTRHRRVRRGRVDHRAALAHDDADRRDP
jgi:hypothetical protein